MSEQGYQPLQNDEKSAKSDHRDDKSEVTIRDNVSQGLFDDLR